MDLWTCSFGWCLADGYRNGDDHCPVGPCGSGRTLTFLTVCQHCEDSPILNTNTQVTSHRQPLLSARSTGTLPVEELHITDDLHVKM